MKMKKRKESVMSEDEQEPVSPEDAVLTADALKAMGHPLRWRILCTLGTEESAPTASLLIDTSLLYPLALDAIARSIENSGRSRRDRISVEFVDVQHYAVYLPELDLL